MDFSDVDTHMPCLLSMPHEHHVIKQSKNINALKTFQIINNYCFCENVYKYGAQE